MSWAFHNLTGDYADRDLDTPHELPTLGAVLRDTA